MPKASTSLSLFHDSSGIGSERHTDIAKVCDLAASFELFRKCCLRSSFAHCHFDNSRQGPPVAPTIHRSLPLACGRRPHPSTSARSPPGAQNSHGHRRPIALTQRCENFLDAYLPRGEGQRGPNQRVPSPGPQRRHHIAMDCGLWIGGVGLFCQRQHPLPASTASIRPGLWVPSVDQCWCRCGSHLRLPARKF
jgi:hypothetical protein